MKKQSRFKDVVEILTGLLWIVVNADKLLMKKYRSWLLNKRIKAAIQQAQEKVYCFLRVFSRGMGAWGAQKTRPCHAAHGRGGLGVSLMPLPWSCS